MFALNVQLHCAIAFVHVAVKYRAEELQRVFFVVIYFLWRRVSASSVEYNVQLILRSESSANKLCIERIGKPIAPLQFEHYGTGKNYSKI